MNELHKLEEYNIDTLTSFIENEIEESIHIEFKSGEALSKTDSKKKEVSKDVSAFANSDGGIIIYGISEKYHKADSFAFVDGTIYTKEWLEQIISTTIKRNIDGLKIFPVRNNGNLKESVYVVQIPSSINAPHLSRDNRFYKRYNFESVPMEEYEIRQTYGRKVKSQLQLSGYSISVKEIGEEETIFTCEAGVQNIGEKYEKDYKVNIYFDNFNKYINLNWRTDGAGRNYDHTKLLNGKTIKITNNSTPTLYPDEVINILRFNFEVKNDNVLKAFEELKIRFLLFYPNGKDEMETELTELSEKVMKDIIESKNTAYNNGYK
jgi:hypothetical protein